MRTGKIMAAEYIVIGHFQFIDDVKKAIVSLKRQGIKDLTLYSPAPNHDLEDELYLGKRRSPVRIFTFLGGLFGCLGAFLMTIWMSSDWPMRTSAKPIVSIPAFVVIGFECTILIGGIVTLLAMLHFCRIPNPFRSPGFRGDFTKDIFGLVVRVPKEQTENIDKELRSFGAKEVEVEYVR